MRTFVDYKSHPYRDVELVEWNTRNSRARELERARPDERCARISDLSRDYGVTHVVLAAAAASGCPGTTETYRDQKYVVVAIDR